MPDIIVAFSSFQDPNSQFVVKKIFLHSCVLSVKLYSALYQESSVKCLGMAHVNKGSHGCTCYPHIHPQIEQPLPALTPQLLSITAYWLVLISCLSEGIRLNWPGWLVTY